MVARILMVGEAWLFAQALGLDLSVWHAVFATAWMTLFASILFFIPGQLGAADGGLALGLLWAGLPWNAGLAVALGRRLRQLLVGTVGLLLFFLELRRHDDGVPKSALNLSASKPEMGG